VGARITQFQPDVVHVHTPFPLLSPAVFRVAARLHVPAVTTVHSYRYSCIAATCYRDGHTCEDCVGTRLKLPGIVHKCYHDSRGASGALTAGLVLHRAIGTFRDINRFITLTDFSRRLLIRDGIPESHITVKPNFVPDPGDATYRPPAQPYVAFVGRLIDVKGVETLLDAWARGNHGLVLRIAGDGPLRGLVEDRARDDPSIQYHGWLDLDDISGFMADATCVVVPSQWYEGGVPLVVLRSLAVGTPVIVSDLENICEDVLRDGSGMAFATGDASSLAGAFATLDSDPHTWRERRTAARDAYARHYSPTANAASLISIYEAVVAESATTSRG
jgi:glycosyltransferase involved in cell wall biosynthesis